MNQIRMKVAAPPKNKPLMLYDGDCSFCRRSAFFLRGVTRREVDFASWHLACGHFPEIHPRYMEEEVKLITPSGYVFGGAEAVFKALSYGSRMWGWTFWFYEHCAPFRWVSEMIYRHVARNRQKYSERVGPFWQEWDSGGQKYEVYPQSRRSNQADPLLKRQPAIPPFPEVVRMANRAQEKAQEVESSAKKEEANV